MRVLIAFGWKFFINIVEIAIAFIISPKGESISRLSSLVRLLSLFRLVRAPGIRASGCARCVKSPRAICNCCERSEEECVQSTHVARGSIGAPRFDGFRTVKGRIRHRSGKMYHNQANIDRQWRQCAPIRQKAEGGERDGWPAIQIIAAAYWERRRSLEWSARLSTVQICDQSIFILRPEQRQARRNDETAEAENGNEAQSCQLIPLSSALFIVLLFFAQRRKIEPEEERWRKEATK